MPDEVVVYRQTDRERTGASFMDRHTKHNKMSLDDYMLGNDLTSDDLDPRIKIKMGENEICRSNNIYN